jgi:ribosome-associated protein
MQTENGRPSKSARKRAADALQELGVELASLPDAEIAAFELPDTLVEALREFRRLTSHGAQLRQRQYIGKLMRKIDPQPVFERLAERKRDHDRNVRAFQRIEQWRDRLLTTGAAAVDELAAEYPAADRRALLELLAAARQERDAGRAPSAARALFLSLKQLLG